MIGDTRINYKRSYISVILKNKKAVLKQVYDKAYNYELQFRG